MENPLPGNGHGGFGERPGETDREQSGTAPQAGSATLAHTLHGECPRVVVAGGQGRQRADWVLVVENYLRDSS